MKKAMDDLRLANLGCFAHSLLLVIPEGLQPQRSVSDGVVSGRMGDFKHSVLVYPHLEDIEIELQNASKTCTNKVEQHIM